MILSPYVKLVSETDTLFLCKYIKLSQFESTKYESSNPYSDVCFVGRPSMRVVGQSAGGGRRERE